MTDSSDSLYEKLKSMGVQLGASHLAPPKKAAVNPHRIEAIFQGADLETAYGPAFITQNHYPHDHWHGEAVLCAESKLDVLAQWCAAPRITSPGGQNIVFLDTETSGLAGGTGTYVFLVGIGYRTSGGF